MHRLFVAVLLVASACGKDEPPAPTPPPAAPTAPAVASPTTPTTPTTPGESGAQAGRETATDKAPAADLAIPAAMPLASRARCPSSPIAGPTVATFHPAILAVGGTTSIDALVGAFGAQAQRAPGIPGEIIDMAAARVKATFGLEGATWFASDRPLRFAVPDPKAWPTGSCCSCRRPRARSSSRR